MTCILWDKAQLGAVVPVVQATPRCLQLSQGGCNTNNVRCTCIANVVMDFHGSGFASVGMNGCWT